MFFFLLLTFIATTLIHFTVADISLGDSDNTNLFLDSDNNQLPSDGSSLWDTDVSLGDAYTDSPFLTDSDPIVGNNDQNDSFELAEVGDLCEAPPSKRTRRDTAPELCGPSDRQGLDQSTVNQLRFPDLFDVFKPKKKATARELLGDPPFGASPTGEDGNPCPIEYPLHLCCLDSNMQWTTVNGLYISYFTLTLCQAGKLYRLE